MPRSDTQEPEDLSAGRENQADSVLDEFRTWGSTAPTVCFVLTDSCQAYAKPLPCGESRLAHVFGPPRSDRTPAFVPWRMYSYHEWSHRDFSLGHKLSTQFHLRTVTPENLQTIQLKRAMDEDSSDPAPIATAYIYTAPCERLMSSAVGICWELKKNKLLRSLIRVDDRLEHSCCTPDLVPARLAQVLGYVHSGSKNEDVCAQYFDEMWLEQRIHATKGGVGDSADADESGDEPAVLTQFFKRNNYSAWENVVATIIVGEEDYVRKLMDLMASKPHPESDLPRLATELYTVDRDGSGAYSHRFVGNFRRNPELFKPGDFEKAAEALHKELYPASDSVTPVDTPRSAKRQRPS